MRQAAGVGAGADEEGLESVGVLVVLDGVSLELDVAAAVSAPFAAPAPWDPVPLEPESVE